MSCEREGCPCPRLGAELRAWQEHSCDNDYCAECKYRSWREYIEMHHAFIDEGVEYRQEGSGQFRVWVPEEHKAFYFMPASGKWRRDRSQKYYRSEGARDFLATLKRWRSQ